MINFIKNKFLALIHNTGLEENKKDIRNYRYITNLSQYILGYVIGVGMGFGIQLFSSTNNNFFNIITSSFIIGFLLFIPGYFFSLPIYIYWKNRNFKMFRKYRYFRKLQDKYFYIDDHVICMLKNKESQYIIISLIENIIVSLKNDRYDSLKFSNNLHSFKNFLKDGNFELAADLFLTIYPKILSYVQTTKDIELSSFDLEMLEAQHSLLDSYLHDNEDHSINTKKIDQENTYSQSIKGSSKIQYQHNKDKKIDWHKLINHQ